MRTLEPLKYLSGSIVIYYVMAACSASPSNGPGAHASASSSSSGGSATGSGSGASSGGAGSGGSSGSAGLSSGGTSSGAGSSGGLPSPVPDANADTTQSGSRLKANYYIGSDGSKQFAYFTDSALGNQQCYFVTADDGTTRCLPTSGSSAYVSQAYFSDTHCSTPVAQQSGTACAAATNAYEYASLRCGNVTYRIYPVTGVYTGTVYSGTAASCTALAMPPGGTTLYSLGQATPASSFQQATIQAM